MSRRTLLALIATIAVGIAHARAEQRVRVTGFFSSLEFHREAGDLNGEEIIISYATTGTEGQHFAYVQLAEGVPQPPQLVLVTVTGARIRFRLAGSDSSLGLFEGVVSADSLIGRFASGWEL